MAAWQMLGEESLPAAVADDQARPALARAIASGAFGPGARVRLENGAVCFDGPRATGRLEVAGARVRWRLRRERAERVRVGQAILLGAAASLASAIWCGWMFHRATPLGAAVALACATLGIATDRARWRRHVRALVESLPVLLDRPA